MFKYVVWAPTGPATPRPSAMVARPVTIARIAADLMELNRDAALTRLLPDMLVTCSMTCSLDSGARRERWCCITPPWTVTTPLHGEIIGCDFANAQKNPQN